MPDQSLPSTLTSTTTEHSKIMLCIWWDQKSLLFYELLKPDDYERSLSATFDSFEPCIARKTQRHDKILLYDNARPVAKVVKKYLEMLK